MDVVEILSTHLVGRRLTQTRRGEHDWGFSFGDFPRSRLGASCPWRILVEGRIAFTGSDDGQKFGLPALLDGEEITQQLLGARVIERISIRSDTGDLSIVFSGEATLEVLNMSAGYEGWQIALPGTSIIGMGGGKLAIYSDKPQS